MHAAWEIKAEEQEGVVDMHTSVAGTTSVEGMMYKICTCYLLYQGGES
jgi:hypothetical protein